MRTVHFSTCVAMGVILLGVQSGTAEEIFSDINRFPGGLDQLNSHHDIDMASVSAFASLEKELMTVNSELADVRARLALVEGGEVVQAGYNSSASGGSGSRCCRNCWCNPCDGVVFDAQLVWLRPQGSEPDETADNRFKTGSRYTIGWMNSCGRSFRVRYFEFGYGPWDNEADQGFLQQEMIDLEYAGRFRLGSNLLGEVSGGMRWTEYEDHDLKYSDTIGPVVGIEIRTQCWCNVALYGLLRQSYQFGSGYVKDEDPPPTGLGSYGITELQFGLEYQRCVCGGTGFFRTLFETQRWTGVEDNDTEDVGLIGFGFAAGITR